jgi:hypothetical protein
MQRAKRFFTATRYTVSGGIVCAFFIPSLLCFIVGASLFGVVGVSYVCDCRELENLLHSEELKCQSIENCTGITNRIAGVVCYDLQYAEAPSTCVRHFIMDAPIGSLYVNETSCSPNFNVSAVVKVERIKENVGSMIGPFMLVGGGFFLLLALVLFVISIRDMIKERYSPLEETE